MGVNTVILIKTIRSIIVHASKSMICITEGSLTCCSLIYIMLPLPNVNNSVQRVHFYKGTDDN